MCLKGCKTNVPSACMRYWQIPSFSSVLGEGCRYICLFVHISCAPHHLQVQYALFFWKQDYLLRFVRTTVAENVSSGPQKVLFLIVFEMEFHSSSRKWKENKNLKHFAVHSWNFESLPPSRSFQRSIKATATTSHWGLSPQRSNTKHQLEGLKCESKKYLKFLLAFRILLRLGWLSLSSSSPSLSPFPLRLSFSQCPSVLT